MTNWSHLSLQLPHLWRTHWVPYCRPYCRDYLRNVVFQDYLREGRQQKIMKGFGGFGRKLLNLRKKKEGVKSNKEPALELLRNGGCHDANLRFSSSIGQTINQRGIILPILMLMFCWFKSWASHKIKDYWFRCDVGGSLPSHSHLKTGWSEKKN